VSEYPRMQITFEAMKALPEYSATNPTGVFVGKTWRRHDGVFDQAFLARGGKPQWLICRYEEASPQMVRGKMTEMCAIKVYRPVIRARAGSRILCR